MNYTVHLLLLTSLVLGSCKPEGCMDKKANNFDAKAKKENNTCKYSAEIVFWSDEQGAARFLNAGSHTFKFYINDKLVATASTSAYWTGTPACGQEGSTTVDFDMESSTQSVMLKAVDNFQKQMWSEVKTIEAGSCNSVQVK